MPKDAFEFMDDPDEAGLEEQALLWADEEAETQRVIARALDDEDLHDEKEERHG